MVSAAPRLFRVAPEPADGCVVCGATARSTIVDAAVIAAQHAWLARFHRRRLRVDTEPRPAAVVEDGAAALEDRADFTQDDARAIVSCRACGLVFRHPRRSPAAVERDYAIDRYGEARLRTLAVTQADAYDGKIATLSTWLARRRRVRVMEIGSFVGSFLAAARAVGWDACGVDPGEEVGSFCRARGLTVHEGTILDVAHPAASIDVVAVWNTFDQIPEPAPVVRAAARLLRAGGLLAVRVPNGTFFVDAIARLGGAGGLRRRLILSTLAWNNLIGFPYLHGYSVATLDRLLAPHGFERLLAAPDTLVPLADGDTKRWAALEERLVKRLCRRRWERQTPGPARLAAAPWIDVYYRRSNGVVAR